MKRLLIKIQHIGAEYYPGRMVRWLLETKSGKSVYCNKCGNIANIIKEGRIFGLTYRIPLCKKHYNV